MRVVHDQHRHAALLDDVAQGVDRAGDQLRPPVLRAPVPAEGADGLQERLVRRALVHLEPHGVHALAPPRDRLLHHGGLAHTGLTRHNDYGRGIIEAALELREHHAGRTRGEESPLVLGMDESVLGVQGGAVPRM